MWHFASCTSPRPLPLAPSSAALILHLSHASLFLHLSPLQLSPGTSFCTFPCYFYLARSPAAFILHLSPTTLLWHFSPVKFLLRFSFATFLFSRSTLSLLHLPLLPLSCTLPNHLSLAPLSCYGMHSSYIFPIPLSSITVPPLTILHSCTFPCCVYLAPFPYHFLFHLSSVTFLLVFPMPLSPCTFPLPLSSCTFP
jgi:hypothetical protein